MARLDMEDFWQATYMKLVHSTRIWLFILCQIFRPFGHLKKVRIWSGPEKFGQLTTLFCQPKCLSLYSNLLKSTQFSHPFLDSLYLICFTFSHLVPYHRSEFLGVRRHLPLLAADYPFHLFLPYPQLHFIF